MQEVCRLNGTPSLIAAVRHLLIDWSALSAYFTPAEFKVFTHLSRSLLDFRTPGVPFTLYASSRPSALFCESVQLATSAGSVAALYELRRSGSAPVQALMTASRPL